jgi:hypothetical protein
MVGGEHFGSGRPSVAGVQVRVRIRCVGAPCQIPKKLFTTRRISVPIPSRCFDNRLKNGISTHPIVRHSPNGRFLPTVHENAFYSGGRVQLRSMRNMTRFACGSALFFRIGGANIIPIPKTAEPIKGGGGVGSMYLQSPISNLQSPVYRFCLMAESYGFMLAFPYTARKFAICPTLSRPVPLWTHSSPRFLHLAIIRIGGPFTFRATCCPTDRGWVEAVGGWVAKSVKGPAGFFIFLYFSFKPRSVTYLPTWFQHSVHIFTEYDKVESTLSWLTLCTLALNVHKVPPLHTA